MAEDLITKRPVTQARPSLELYFKGIPEIADINFGTRMSSAQFSCMLNEGYIFKAHLNDAHFNVISKLVELGYFKTARNQPLEITFRLKASPDGGEHPKAGTLPQTAYVTQVRSFGNSADLAHIEFIAIDPPSYLLNRGGGAGKSYQGKVSNVIKQVVNEYAPQISVDVSETIDSDKNRFWMMRQDPQVFIGSLLDWSAPLTKTQTQWIVAPDGTNLSIKAQAEIKPRERAYYTYWEPVQISTDSILGWDFIADNTLTLSQAQIISQGLSAVSGAYYDKITDSKEQKVVVDDENTGNKILAAPAIKPEEAQNRSFTKPARDSALLGATSVPAPPEIYSGGEMGLGYDDYLAGKARNVWLNSTRRLIRCRLKIYGHGEWSNGLGLGTDTIRILWMAAPRGDQDEATQFLMSGNWLVYGFEHDLRNSGWVTYLHIARFDWNANANFFPKSS